LDARTPGQSGERVAAFAWWASDRIAKLFGNESEAIREVHETTIEPEYTFSIGAWQLTIPPVVPDELRFGTLMVNSIWSISLQGQVLA
jgi:hypothetical protein